MNIIKFFLFFYLAFLFDYTSLANGAPVATDENQSADAVLQVKRALPFCSSDTSVYRKLAKLGEQPFGHGVEKSKMAIERKGLSLGFTLNPKTGMWSILNTDNRHTTCFVAMGKNWRQSQEAARDKLFKGETRQVGYSVPFAKMEEELSKEGKTLAGFDDQDLDLTGSNILKKTTYLFTDNSGLFTFVTSMTYKNGSGVPYEFSSIDAVGTHWVWTSPALHNNFTSF